MRTNFPEAWSRLKAMRARHPREDAIEEYTQWTILGQPIEAAPVRQEPAPASPSSQPNESQRKQPETEEMYIQRRTETLMHQNLSCRRQAGGQFFTVGGGGDGSCAFQVR